MDFITAVAYEESVWMKVRGERGRSALYIGCVSTDSTSVVTCYERHLPSFREKGKVVLLGDLRVGKAADDDNVIGKFGEDTCNASGNKLISLLREVELVACKGRQLTRVD